MAESRKSRKYNIALKQAVSIFFQAAVAFGAIMTGLEAGRHLNWW